MYCIQPNAQRSRIVDHQHDDLEGKQWIWKTCRDMFLW